jgi:hypothetical protein
LVQLHRTKVRKLRTLQEEENRRLELLEEEVFNNRYNPKGAIVHWKIGVGECEYCMHDDITSHDFSI